MITAVTMNVACHHNQAPDDTKLISTSSRKWILGTRRYRENSAVTTTYLHVTKKMNWPNFKLDLFCLYFFFQGLTLARHVLYHLSRFTSVLRTISLGWPPTTILLISASWVARLYFHLYFSQKSLMLNDPQNNRMEQKSLDNEYDAKIKATK
jgi:hypothetical protein